MLPSPTAPTASHLTHSPQHNHDAGQDDPLSSLDNEVAHHVFERSIKRMLLRTNRTVILVTQQLSLVQQADYLIVMKDGRLQASGSYKDIEIKHSHIIAKWNAIIAKANETEQQKNDAVGRTARERWKLFKNVSKLSLQRSISLTESTTSTSTAVGVGVVSNDAETEITATTTTTGTASTTTANADNNSIGAVAVDDAVVVVDDDDDVLVPVSMPAAGSPLCGSQSFGGFAFTRKRSSVYGSRHLIYDVPLPIDECQTDDVIMRRRRRSSSTLDAGAVATLQTRRRRSSRFSGISASSTDTQRRSLLTASCSSATSYTSSNASCYSNDTTSSITSATKTKTKTKTKATTKGNGKIPKRANSWQPQSKTTTADVFDDVDVGGDVDGDVTDAVIAHNKNNTNNKSKNKNKLQHQPVTRNISSPGSFCYTNHQQQPQEQQEEEEEEQSPHATNVNDGILIADLVQSTQLEGGFQQFLRRMSMRRSNKPSTVTTHRIHRPLSATNSILSISEETPSPTTTIPATTTTTILPTIELSTVATEAEFEIDTETVENIDQAKSAESWITNNTVAGVGADNVDRKLKMVTPATVSLSLTATSVSSSTTTFNNNNSNTATLTAVTQTTTTSTTTTTTAITTGTDTERKYGEIPAKIYLLYLRASGPIIVLIFFISALIWQGLRVYTDMWLRQWSDNNIYNNNNNNNNTSSNVVVASRTDNDIGSGIRIDDNNNDIGIGIDMVSAQHEVTYYFSVYAGISCVCIVMALISTPAGQLAGCLARRNLHEKLLQAIMHKSLHFFQLTPLGRIMNRFSNDMAIIDMKIAATSQRLLQFTLLCLCAVLINVVITPWFILLTLPICVAYYVVQKFFRCSARELQRIENSTNSPIISHLAETIQGVTTIRAYNQEARFTEILFRRLEANTIAFTLLSTSNRWLGISLDYLGGVIVFVAIVTALLTATVSCSQHMAKITNNNVDIFNSNNNNNHTNNTLWSLWHGEISPTPSLVGLAINYTLLMPIYLNWVVKYLADMEMYVGSVERIAYYTEEPINSISRHINVASVDDDKNLQINDHDDGNNAANVDNDKSIMQATIEEVEHKMPTDKEATTTMKSTTLTTMECNDTERRESLRRISVTTDKRYKTVPISWPQRGDITFENVSLRYEGQTEYVIKDFNLHIPAGQRLGICGRTGSGKSTLALSLFGVLQTSGRICIDDVDITQIHPDEMRTRLSIIPQDVHLFSATIRENLDPHGYYSDLALWNCLELAQLKEFVNAKLSAGLDTRIMDGGIHLSTGHRQLFCLARAILRGSVCLVLDEATSALDSSTERALLTTAHKTFHGRTIISIAHRLSTILDYDRIIVMENGRIIDDGHPQELQRRTNSAFYALLHAKPTQLLGIGDGVGDVSL